jgi:hypothetical protein
MPTDDAVADIRLGDDLAVYIAVNAGAPENAQAASVALRFVD